MSTLHYIYDPLCGWCYAAAPLVKVARAYLPVHAHGGGMMTGPNRQRVSPQLRQFVTPHDQRIAQQSGQPFGPGYTQGLLFDETAVLDSAPPTAAVLAAESLAGHGLDMIARLQQAHYVEGRRIADAPVLVELAKELGLDAEAFSQALAQAPTDEHIAATRQLMARTGARGFPTLLLEREGRFETIDVGRFIGQVPAWEAYLQQRLGTTAPGSTGTSDLACGLDGCAVN